MQLAGSRRGVGLRLTKLIPIAVGRLLGGNADSGAATSCPDGAADPAARTQAGKLWQELSRHQSYPRVDCLTCAHLKIQPAPWKTP